MMYDLCRLMYIALDRVFREHNQIHRVRLLSPLFIEKQDQGWDMSERFEI